MGCGRVGSTLAHILEAQGHDVAVIDNNESAFRRLGSDFVGRRVTGIGFDRDTLLEAGIEDADAFAAVSSGDNSNILAARVARETFGVDNVVARIYDPGRAEVYQRLGIPTVATVRWTADQMIRRLLPHGSEPEWRDPSGSVLLAEVQVDTAWVGERISRLEEETGARVAFLTRLGEGSARGRHGPAGRRPRPRRDARRRRRCCRGTLPQPSQGDLMRVTIAGAGSVGRSVARELLDNGHEVLLIDRDPAAIKKESVAKAEWLLADACEVTSLEEAGLHECQVVIAATGDDKVNLVVSLLAKTEYGVPRTVARVNNPKNEWMFDEAWGVDVAVSMPRLMTALVEEAVSVGDLVRIFTFQQSNTDLVEMTLPADSPMSGSRVGDVAWPPDTALVAIIREGRPIVPSPDDPLESGDELLFVATTDMGPALEQLLAPHEHGADPR